MLKPGIREFLGIIHTLVQSDDGGDVVAMEVAEVMLRGVQRVVVLNATLVVRTSECNEFT